MDVGTNMAQMQYATNQGRFRKDKSNFHTSASLTWPLCVENTK